MRHSADGPRWRTALRAGAGVLAWSAGAAGAIVVGILALSLISGGLADQTMPLAIVPGSQSGAQDVESAAAPTPSASRHAKPQPSRSTARPKPTAVERTMTFTSGAVTARCEDDLAYLVSWSPAQGYRTDDVRRGPASMAKVTFESHRAEYAVLVGCVDGTPQGTVVHDR